LSDPFWLIFRSFCQSKHQFVLSFLDPKNAKDPKLLKQIDADLELNPIFHPSEEPKIKNPYLTDEGQYELRSQIINSLALSTVRTYPARNSVFLQSNICSLIKLILAFQGQFIYQD
jgi:hypothetical protein